MVSKFVSRKMTVGLAAVAVAAFLGASGQLALAQASEDDAEDAAVDGEAAEDGEAAGGDELMAELMTEGESLFTSNCETCHGEAGEGGAGGGPALAGSQTLSSIGTITRQIINGGERMPSFTQLSDRQVAAVGTYIRNSWGNAFGIVTEEDVAGWR